MAAKLSDLATGFRPEISCPNITGPQKDITGSQKDITGPQKDITGSQMDITGPQMHGNTVTRRLTRGKRSEKCAVKCFLRCANVVDGTYTNLDHIPYYIPRLYGIAYYS
jgi:hypothetical protein